MGANGDGLARRAKRFAECNFDRGHVGLHRRRDRPLDDFDR
jgi:hypothetical protein